MADEPDATATAEPPAPPPEPAPAPERAGAPERPTPDAPAREATPAETPAPSPARVEGTPDAAPGGASDWWNALETVDPRELLKHPRVGGIIGSRLEAERRRAAQEAERLLEARQADEQLETLRKTDPDAYAAEVGRRKEEAARQGQVYSGIHARIATWQTSLPPEVQKAVSGKTYPGSYEDGVLAYTRDVAEAYAEHRAAEAVERARTQWEKDVRPAIRQEVLAELNGGEPAPDTTRGAAPANGFKVPTTLAELNRLPTSVYKEHMREIEAAVLSGRVK